VPGIRSIYRAWNSEIRESEGRGRVSSQFYATRRLRGRLRRPRDALEQGNRDSFLPRHPWPMPNGTVFPSADARAYPPANGCRGVSPRSLFLSETTLRYRRSDTCREPRDVSRDLPDIGAFYSVFRIYLSLFVIFLSSPGRSTPSGCIVKIFVTRARASTHRWKNESGRIRDRVRIPANSRALLSNSRFRIEAARASYRERRAPSA